VNDRVKGFLKRWKCGLVSTPITDAYVDLIERQRGYRWQYDDGWVTLARGLEGQLDEAQQEIAEQKKWLKAAKADLDLFQAEVTELKDWKRQQLEVESEWDAQKVAEALGIPLGESIRASILARVNELSEDKKRLDRIFASRAVNIFVMCSTPGGNPHEEQIKSREDLDRRLKGVRGE